MGGGCWAGKGARFSQGHRDRRHDPQVLRPTASCEQRHLSALARSGTRVTEPREEEVTSGLPRAHGPSVFTSPEREGGAGRTVSLVFLEELAPAASSSLASLLSPAARGAPGSLEAESCSFTRPFIQCLLNTDSVPGFVREASTLALGFSRFGSQALSLITSLAFFSSPPSCSSVRTSHLGCIMGSWAQGAPGTGK